MKRHLIFLYCVSTFALSCTNTSVTSIVNEKQGRLKSTHKLEITSEKKFPLDSVTAPRPNYTQVYTNSTGNRFYTILNTYNNSIYFYDYAGLKFIKKISFDNLEPKPDITAFHIKSSDSIYLYNERAIELLLTDSSAKTFKKISLIGSKNIRKDPWMYMYPQYNTQTAIPFIQTLNELLFTGEFIGQIPDDIIRTFKFTAGINYSTNEVKFSHTYPIELYGGNKLWHNIPFTEVYLDYDTDNHKLVYSFPVSHNLYISDLNTDKYDVVYGGSNEASTITSLKANQRDIDADSFLKHIGETDEYGSIKYDKYRKLYYRFLYKSIHDDGGVVTVKTKWKQKPVSIIIMDKHFNYLGETPIGLAGDWNLKNVFVTKEGLNIEHVGHDIDEMYLTLKILTLKKI
ncbi:DUF4221 domain-containing protein [Mucilaginibacter limnophilus]|uniref:DUF4221 domain-containing protein n=1 Tax=Mucilaginibacter limnophilus TaxID=1932778 RepID=A0A437MHT7_9SPHI|nr:DUF4221 family protein [Mucilaginibacter limnophilus]RVT97202.1 DUF4221 domain-containing protein [Mucilaginibacter limnophilus]